MKHLVNSLFILSFLILSACSSPSENTRAFYYWQTSINLSDKDQALQNKLGVKDMYIRCFDVDWSYEHNQPVPRGVAEIHDLYWNMVDTFNLIPTIFIVNRVFAYIPEEEIEAFAQRILRKIPFSEEIISEIQIDCDWSESTKDKYFTFLKVFKKQIPGKTLSSTIRLHQYRDRKLMGIPPVDRGMLMIYNMNNPKISGTKNSILDTETASYYLKGKKYPLKLDIALPIFYWGKWSRNSEFQNLLSGWDMKDASDTSTYEIVGNATDHIFKVKKDTVISRHYLREGDQIQIEGSFDDEMERTIALIQDRIKPQNVRIAFFDWNLEKIKHHETNLEKYYRLLH